MMKLEPCVFAGWQHAGAAQVKLVRGLAVEREQARLQARAALGHVLAAELGCALHELEIGNLRNQAPVLRLGGQVLAAAHCSISHGSGLALLAWRAAGPVGVDLQAVETAAPRRELQDVAKLFLEPKTAQALACIARDALFFPAFAKAWTRHEARLKCAGLGLVEWSQALGARLAGMEAAELPLSGGYAAAVAWQ